MINDEFNIIQYMLNSKNLFYVIYQIKTEYELKDVYICINNL